MDDKTIIRTMVKEAYTHNAKHLQADLQWLGELMKRRYESQHDEGKTFHMPVAPSLTGNSVYKSILQQFKFTAAERLVLLLALIPHIAPYYLDEVWLQLNNSA